MGHRLPRKRIGIPYPLPILTLNVLLQGKVIVNIRTFLVGDHELQNNLRFILMYDKISHLYGFYSPTFQLVLYGGDM